MNDITVLKGRSDELWANHSGTLNEMFWDRRAQFCEELGWDLNVDMRGREIDDYDNIFPTYVILTDKYGGHHGSGRLLPMSGRTMLVEIFGHLLPEDFNPAPGALEVTRVFVPKGEHSNVERMILTTRLLLAGVEEGLERGAPELWGCTYPAMVKVFARAGWPASFHKKAELEGFGTTSICCWPVNDDVRRNLQRIVNSYG